MARRLYKVDYWGNLQRDRDAEKRIRASGGGPGWTGRVFLVLGLLTLLIVFASALH